MVEHDDGSVTISAVAFRSLALFCQMTRDQLKDLLRDKGEGLSQADLKHGSEQFASLFGLPEDGARN